MGFFMNGVEVSDRLLCTSVSTWLGFLHSVHFRQPAYIGTSVQTLLVLDKQTLSKKKAIISHSAPTTTVKHFSITIHFQN